jgi:hypothetical protein
VSPPARRKPLDARLGAYEDKQRGGGNRLDIIGDSAFDDQVLQAPLITPVHDPSVEADSYDRGASISLMRSSDIPTRRDFPARKSGTSSGGIGLMPEDLEERASVRT